MIESEDEDIVPSTPVNNDDGPKCRRRKRKLVQKTFKDEDGFMVTKKEYESFSESEEEPDKTAEHKPEKKTKTQPEPEAKKGGKKKVMAQQQKQSSIMSFFKKS